MVPLQSGKHWQYPSGTWFMKSKNLTDSQGLHTYTLVFLGVGKNQGMQGTDSFPWLLTCKMFEECKCKIFN